MSDKVIGVARRHWFYLALPFLFAAAVAFRETHPWATQPRLGEAATLFDWCLFVPLLHAICYRSLPRRALVLRVVATMCGGVWIARRIIPDSAEFLVTQWGWLRDIGIALLVVAEAIAAVAVVRLAFGAAPDPAALERQGIPPPLVRLMLAEARFWRRLWMWVSGR